VERGNTGKVIWLETQKWKCHLKDISLNARILQYQTNFEDRGYETGHWIYLAYDRVQYHMIMMYLCLCKWRGYIDQPRNLCFCSGFYTMDSVSWLWWYMDPVQRAAKCNVTAAFNTHLFIRLLCQRWWNFACFEITLLGDKILVTDCPSLHWSWHFIRDKQTVTCKEVDLFSNCVQVALLSLS
jgi:hypothetical protein